MRHGTKSPRSEAGNGKGTSDDPDRRCISGVARPESSTGVENQLRSGQFPTSFAELRARDPSQMSRGANSALQTFQSSRGGACKGSVGSAPSEALQDFRYFRSADAFQDFNGAQRTKRL